MNGEFEQCLKCFHVWEYEDDRCPHCGHPETEEFDPKVKLKELRQQIKELKATLRARDRTIEIFRFNRQEDDT